jgi:Ni,Fe-hydrogenase III small subunit
MGCICSQAAKNNDLYTAPDNQSKPVAIIFDEDEPNNNNTPKDDRDIMANSKITFKDSHIGSDMIDNDKFSRKNQGSENQEIELKSDNESTEVKSASVMKTSSILKNSNINGSQDNKSNYTGGRLHPIPEDNMEATSKEQIYVDEVQVDNSTLSKVKKKKRRFDLEIVDMINDFRINPRSYVDKLLNMIDNVNKLSNNKLVYHKKGQPRIVMSTGESAIREIADYISKLNPMEKLEVRKEIAIPVPVNPDYWTNSYSMLVEDKTKELKAKSKTKYNILSFHFDLSVSDPETSLLLQLVDDNSFKGLRRSHICDPEMKYIAVTYTSINPANSDVSGGDLKKPKDKKFCSYFTFAK